MKYILLLFALLFSTLAVAQDTTADEVLDLDQLAAFESQKAKGTIQFKSTGLTSNYDLKYHRLEWEVDPRESYIRGTVTSHFQALDEMNEIVFDLADNLSVLKVVKGENELEFHQSKEDRLHITLNQTLDKGKLDSISITYQGNPVSS